MYYRQIENGHEIHCLEMDEWEDSGSYRVRVAKTNTVLRKSLFSVNITLSATKLCHLQGLHQPIFLI